MKQLVLLDALHSGSHAAWSRGLADALPAAGWQVEVHSLPGRHWKWRMHGAAWWFGSRLAGPPPDALLVTDMLDAARLRGHLPPAWRSTPLVSYFHENQVTFPWKSTEDRDQRVAYAFANIQSAWASDEVWFNSQHHREVFLAGIPAVLERMPDARPEGFLPQLEAKFHVLPPGIHLPPVPENALQRPLHRPVRLLWNHRWARDKHPEHFVATCNALRERGTPFEVDLLGPGPRTEDSPLLEWAHAHPEQVASSEPAADRSAYAARLAAADVIAHDPLQEYFGISVVEALHAGVLPVLPKAHAYPEYASAFPFARHPREAAATIGRIARAPQQAVAAWRQTAHESAARFAWDRMLPDYAAALDRVTGLAQ